MEFELVDEPPASRKRSQWFNPADLKLEAMRKRGPTVHAASRRRGDLLQSG